MQANGLLVDDGQGEENHAEFSTDIDSGDRTIIQAVSIQVKGPRAAGGIRLVDPRVE